MQRRIRMGMVGGGRGSFIGAVHRMAAGLDGLVELVCGAFSADPATSKASGRDLLLDDERCYGSWREMLEREAGRAASERIDLVAIVTPNHLHHPVAMAALGHGFDVACDKPMTLDLAQALELRDAVASSGRLFCLTHNYTGYPMVKEARHLVAAGRLGPIRKVVVEYPQGWLAERLEATGQKQAAWRTDPARAGAAGCMGDIGTHCLQLAEHVAGLEVESLCADLTTFVPGRRLDDDGSVLLRFAGGARGVLHASQVSVGEENALRLRVYGERGGLDWRQEEPNTLVLRWPDRPAETQRTAGPTVSNAARRATRLPMGHPEGFIEAFANLYRELAVAIDARRRGGALDLDRLDLPGVKDGVRGMRFLEAVVESSRAGAWVAVASDAGAGLPGGTGMIEPRPVTLFTGQWADLPLETLCEKAAAFGYDGLELACWGDHFDPARALDDDAYCRARRDLLERHGLRVWAISNHLVGQAVCDRIDERHRAILPSRVWGDGDAEGVRRRAAEEMQRTAHAAARLGVSTVNGFTGSSIWHLAYSFPPVPPAMIDAGLEDFARRWTPILDVFAAEGLRFGLEVHPTEIAFDISSAERAIEALDGHRAFGFNYDPSHLGYQGVDYVEFLHRFCDRIVHVHMKDAWWSEAPRDGGVHGGYLPFGDRRRSWNFRSPGRGSIDFEEVLRALNRIGYRGPLSVEWEDDGMDREHGAVEACEFVRALDFPPSSVAFDTAFGERTTQQGES